MKYLSKPPLFSEQNKNSQEKGQSESYKEFIDAQKTKAIERDQRYIFKTRGKWAEAGRVGNIVYACRTFMGKSSQFVC